MATASALIADVQIRLGDPSGNIFATGTLLNWLNEAQKAFCLHAMPLREVDATSVATGANRFYANSSRFMMEGCFSRNSIGISMKRLNFTDFNTQMGACPGARGHDSDMWTEYEDAVLTHPAYGTKASTTLLSANITKLDTTIPVASTSAFRAWGRARIESEEIEYYDKDATNLYKCSRGLAGTTAAAHIASGGTSVVQLDLWMVYRRMPTTMLLMTDEPEIRAAYHDRLELYLMYLAYKQEGSEEKAEAAWRLWQAALHEARWSAAREHLGHVPVHDAETMQVNSLYGPR